MTLKQARSKYFWLYYILEILKQIIITPVFLAICLLKIVILLIEEIHDKIWYLKCIYHCPDNWFVIMNPRKIRKRINKRTE